MRDLCESIHLIIPYIGWLTERACLQPSKFGDTLHRLALTTAVLGFIGVTGCATKFLDQAISLQGTRTEELRDWDRKDKQRDKLIVFVHGFNSSKDEAWGQFPALIKTDEDFASFNLHRFGYRTAILRQSTDIEHEGEFLTSFLKETLPQYRSTILVGHSMGGLVILHALLTLERDAFKLLSDANLQVVTFGTPYQGVKNAGALATLFNNKQAKDMEIFSRQYVRLRENWERRINRPATLGERESPQVPIFVYSGTADDFVDEASARGAPGLAADRGTVDGDHGSMVKPKDRDHLAYRKLRAVALTGMQKVPPTPQGKIGIWVARLTGDDASYAEQRGVIGRLEHLISQTEPQLYEAVEIRKLPVEIQGDTLRDKEQTAKRLGQEHHAAIVVWGEVTKQAGVVELQPRVTLVRPLSLPIKTVVLAPLSPHASQLPHLNRPPETVHVPPQPIHQEPIQLARIILSFTFIEQQEWTKAAQQLDLYLDATRSEAVREADIYFYAGLAHANEHNASGTSEQLIQARERYEKAKVGYQTEQDWVTYAAVLNNLGITYLALAQREIVSKENFESWMAALKETSCRTYQHKKGLSYRIDQEELGSTYWTLAHAAMTEAACRFHEQENWARYATAQTNLGLIYLVLAQHGVGPKANIQRAVTVITEAVHLTRDQEDCQLSAVVLNNLGIVYGMQAERGVTPTANLQRAMTAFMEATRLCKERNDWAQSTMFETNLGITYRKLAEHGDVPREHFQPAIEALTKTPCRDQQHKHGSSDMTVQKNLGHTYWMLAQETLREAVCRFQELKNRAQYAMAQANLGVTYRMLAEYGVGSEEDLQNAMMILTEVADLYKEQKDSTRYAMARSDIGLTYLAQAQREVKPAQSLQQAMTAFTEAGLLSKKQDNWAHYAINLNSLGVTYRRLAEQEATPKEHFQSAMTELTETACQLQDQMNWSSYTTSEQRLSQSYWALAETALREAACWFQKQNHWPRYTLAKNELGLLYLALAKREVRPVEHLQQAMTAFMEVAHMNKKLEDWVHYPLTLNNLGLTYQRLAENGIDPKEHFQSTMTTLTEPACQSEEQKHGLNYGTAQQRLSQTYWVLAETALTAAACRFQKQKNSARYKTAQENLGRTYRMMAKHGIAPDASLKLAEKAFEKASSPNPN